MQQAASKNARETPMPNPLMPQSAMYAGYGFRDYEIGDVDVVRHGGLYHLFHLTLPNHDYIAHAVSEDGLRWRRVKNALFISDPPAWDDDMLWTMHVSPDPYRDRSWRMFYTGLCMRERGRVQRVGLARSTDLYHWEKDDSGRYPLRISEDHYEHDPKRGRQWVSFRDPFCYREDGKVYLLAAARVKTGPVIRRGCVALVEETDENRFDFHPPLFHPMHYDDLEVPNLIRIDGCYYLIASIREDVKVHYWYADTLTGPYRNYFDNVLMPQGNYAARVSEEDGRHLVWNFFFKGLTTQGSHLMAPPKELVADDGGHLRLKTFSGFNDLVAERYRPTELMPLFDNPHGTGKAESATCWIGCESGFEAFLLRGEYRDFMLSGSLNLEGEGKCGLVFRLDGHGDGYYLSLDLFKGIAQIRGWGRRPDGGFEEAFDYEQLQAGFYVATEDPHEFCLLVYEQYIEFSLDGYVLLTLADDRYEKGRLGFYVETARIRIDELELKVLRATRSESYPTCISNY